MFDTGFSMDVTKTAQTDARESEMFLRWAAREYGAAVLGGVVGPAMGGTASNEAVCFAPDGSELVRYRKMQPFTLAGEDKKYGCGDRHRVFEWQGVRIAPFICYDLRFPERFRPAAREGAELITVSACWPTTRSEHWVRLLQARAIENLAYVVGVNRCGEEPTLKYDGRTTAFDQMGVALFEANAAEQVLTTEVDVEAVRAWRDQFPALRDMSVC
jgi:predicted amidohydrolase